jgi:hypothetical protein
MLGRAGGVAIPAGDPDALAQRRSQDNSNLYFLRAPEVTFDPKRT